MGSSTTLKGDDGIIPRVMEEMFRRIDEADQDAKPVVRVSFMELYKEELKDLLDTNTKKEIKLYETDKGPSVQNCSERTVDNLETMQQCLEEGSSSRVTAATKMNEQSSRSHAIFTVHIEQQVDDDVTTAKFHFVDLAGSERASKTEAVGEQLVEGIKINQSLFALGNVISALGDDNKKGDHVPYRDSKLTRLLQDSLGGNSRTVMIACVSPADFNAGESETTLRYANRARNITNKPVKNIDPNKAQILELKQQLMFLCKEMQDMKEAGGHGAQQEHVIANLRIELDAALQTAQNASARQLQAEIERDRIRTLLSQNGLEGVDGGDNGVSEEEMSVIEHHVRTIQEQDAKILDLTLRINANSVHGLEYDADEGEEEIVKEEAAHNSSMGRMEAEMKSLMENLASKEADIDAANSTINEEQFTALESELNKLKSEHSALLKQMEKGSFEENKGLQRKVAVLEKQMKDAKKKQDDYKRLKHLQARGELRVKEVETEMDTLKKKKVALSRKMSEDSKKFTEWKTARSREVAALKRDAQRQTYELSKMAGQKAKTESVLKRKMEEIAAANRRMKGMSDQLAAAKKHRSATNSSRMGGVGLARTNSKDLTVAQKQQAIQERRQWLEEELSLCGKVRTAKKALEKETEERKLKQTEVAMMQANLERLRERGVSEESTSKIQGRIGDVTMELEAKEGLIVELQKQLVGTEEIQSASKRWDFLKQMDDAKNYIKSTFALALNLMEERDASADKLAGAEEAARVSHAQVVQMLYEERASSKKEAMEMEESQKWQVTAALTKGVEGSEIAAMLEEAHGTIKGLRVGINEASSQKEALERENRHLKAAIQENGGFLSALPDKEEPAPVAAAADSSETEMMLMALERKYGELEKSHGELKEEFGSVKRENHTMRQMAKKRRHSNEGKLHKPTWNSGLSTLKTKEDQDEIERIKLSKLALPRKPALPKLALAKNPGDTTARADGSNQEELEYAESESEFESESDFDYDTDDSDFEMGSAKKRRGIPATPRAEVQPSAVKAVVAAAAVVKKPVVADETAEKRYNKTALNKMKVADVRELCQEKLLDTKGKKDFLVQRVLEYYTAKDNHDEEELRRLLVEGGQGEESEEAAAPAAPVVEASVAEAVAEAEETVEWGETFQHEESEEVDTDAVVAEIMDVTEPEPAPPAPVVEVVEKESPAEKDKLRMRLEALAQAGAGGQTVNTTAGGAVLFSNIKKTEVSGSAKKRTDMREAQMAKYRKEQESKAAAAAGPTPGKRKLHTSRVLSEMDTNESPVGTPTKAARTPCKSSPMPVSMREPSSEDLTKALQNARLLSEPRLT